MVEIKNIVTSNIEESIIASGLAMTTKPYNYSAEREENFSKHLKRATALVMNGGGGSGHSNFRTGMLVSFDIKYPLYISPELQRYHWVQIVTSQSKMHRLTAMSANVVCNKYVSQQAVDNLQFYIDRYNRIADMAWNETTNVAFTFRDLSYRGTNNRDEALYYAYMQCIANTPAGIELWMRVTTNYEQLATIYRQRKNHKLKEDWGAFIGFIKSLPYAELITEDYKGKKKAISQDVKAGDIITGCTHNLGFVTSINKNLGTLDVAGIYFKEGGTTPIVDMRPELINSFYYSTTHSPSPSGVPITVVGKGTINDEGEFTSLDLDLSLNR